MSGAESSVRVRVRAAEVVIEVRRPAEGRNQDGESEGEWCLVEGPPETGPTEGLELVVATGPAPLHLVRRSRLSTVAGWTPEDRIRRAYRLGQEDCQVALDSGYQSAKDSFPVSSAVYVVLYDPSGDWPRYTRTLSRFYEAIKEPLAGRKPDRHSPWRRGVVSRGFPSIVEAEAYLEGASCRFPNAEF